MQIAGELAVSICLLFLLHFVVVGNSSASAAEGDCVMETHHNDGRVDDVTLAEWNEYIEFVLHEHKQ